MKRFFFILAVGLVAAALAAAQSTGSTQTGSKKSGSTSATQSTGSSQSSSTASSGGQSSSTTSATQSTSSSASTGEIPDYVFEQSILGTNLSYLYPGMDWTKNVATILQFHKKVLLPYANYAGSTTKTTVTNLAQNPFPKGTSVKTSSSRAPSLYFSGYMPFLGNMVGGLSANYSSSTKPSTTVLTNFTAANQKITTTNPDNFNYTLGASGSYGIQLGELGLGGFASYNSTTTPAANQFTKTSNSAILSGASFYGTGPVGAYGFGNAFPTTTNGTFSVAGGATYANGPLGAGLGIGYSSQTIDNSNVSVAVDETGNGYAQTLVNITTFETSTKPWGGGLTSFSYKNTKTLHTLDLYPSVTYKLNSQFTLIGSGSWEPLATDTTMYYDRTSSTDKSETTTSSNSGLGTFTAIAGVKYTPFSTLELRAGAGYKMSSTDYTTSQLNAAGNSTYSTNNPNHYAPFASATDPTSGQVATVAVTPTNSVTGTPLAEVGAKWSPLPRVAFFATASLSDPITTDTYYAYDTTTNKVWSQVNKSSSFNWSLGGLVGMAIRLSSNFTLAAYTGNLPSLGLSGSASSTNPGLPSSGGTTSNNLTGTSTTTSSNSFNAFVSGVITF